MSTNAESSTAAGHALATANNAVSANTGANTQINTHTQMDRPSLTEALTLRRNLLQSLWIGIRQLPRGRRIVLMIRICISLAQIVAFIPVLALPGSQRVSPSHETGRVCNPDSLFKYLVVHMVRLALDIPVELYLGLSPHRTRRGRRAGPEARAIAERDRPLGSEYLDVKVGKISTLLGIASLVIFFVGNAIVYSSTECSQKPAEAVPLFWAALASLIVVYIFILEIAVLAFLIVCALPLLIMVMRGLGLTHRLPQRELHPETGKIQQNEVDRLVRLVYYTPEEATERVEAEAKDAATQQDGGGEDEVMATRPELGSRRPTQETVQSASQATFGRLTRLARILVARQRSGTHRRKEAAPSSNLAPSAPSSTPQAESATIPTGTQPKPPKRGKLKYPLHPLPAHRATCPICLCDFEEPQPDQQPEPEPLRLLDCGHVMHRGCVDQWLTTVSGRCPVCQRAVIPEVGEEREEEVPQGQQSQQEPRQGNAEAIAQPTMVEAQQPSDEIVPDATGTDRMAADAQESLELQPMGSAVNSGASQQHS